MAFIVHLVVLFVFREVIFPETFLLVIVLMSYYYWQRVPEVSGLRNYGHTLTGHMACMRASRRGCVSCTHTQYYGRP